MACGLKEGQLSVAAAGVMFNLQPRKKHHESQPFPEDRACRKDGSI
jgi:hypothetical protein